MKLFSILKQPFPITQSFRGKVIMSLWFGAFIFVFILVFKPFELETVAARKLLWLAFSYGFITGATILSFSLLLPTIFPSFFQEHKWTTGRAMLIVAFEVTMVGVANYLASPWLIDSDWSWRSAMKFQEITITMGLLPIVLFTLIRQNQLLRTFRDKAKLLEQKLQEKQKLQVPFPEENGSNAEVIHLEGDYQNERISIPAHQLYMVQSANNYIKVYFEQKGKVAYSIIRLTMKKAEDVLVANSVFFRCHRMYIINLDKITHVEGNAQGYKVKMEGVEESIPISRNFSSEFSDKLLAIRKGVYA